ncbi:MAG: PA14 domain-containing protein [Planctomycetota bacterium]|jgi:hypothetical protein
MHSHRNAVVPLERGIVTAVVALVSVSLAVAVGIARPGSGVGGSWGGWGAVASGSDCNNNGADDAAELEAGFSADCNGNGIPDECDVNGGGSDDGNNNQLPDECETLEPNGLIGTYVGTFTGVVDNDEGGDNVEPFTLVGGGDMIRGRIDADVNLDISAGGSPWPGMSRDLFSINWSGYVVPEQAGEYTFHLDNDDSALLIVDGELLIDADRFFDSPVAERSGVIELESFKEYRIRVEYASRSADDGGPAIALSWTPPGGSKTLIPSSNLLPYRDCNGNGIPDDGDIAQAGLFYAHDDNSTEATVQSDGVYTAWFNRYVIADGFDTITAVDGILAEFSGLGTAATVGVWSDPDGDGSPADAQLLSSADLILGGGFQHMDIPDVVVGPDGTSFFVGVVHNAPFVTSANIDLDAPHVLGASWIIGRDSPFDPNDLDNAAVEFALIEDALVQGNWALRAITNSPNSDCNGNEVPDDPACENFDDCQPDGIPDECQLGELVTDLYQLDDGNYNSNWGIDQPGEVAILNQFTVELGKEYASGVVIGLGEFDAGQPLTIYLWNDPNQDGDPSDAQVLASVEGHSCSFIEDCTYELPLTFLGNAKLSFFAGVVYNSVNVEGDTRDGIWLDHDNVLEQTWVVARLDGNAIDPNDLGNGADYLGLVDNYDIPPGSPQPASAAIRVVGSSLYPNDCNNTGIPDACEEDCNDNGVADECDPDADGDDIPDDCDDCPNDADNDIDGDGFCADEDNCPDDFNDTQADADGDDIGDACDDCTDSDNDGFGDPGFPNNTCEEDGCPDDPNKSEPGQCGCGIADDDDDMDGTANCNDGCPDDPEKTEPGECGCGVSEDDDDMDGTPNCNDGCPDDPDKTEPGECGCGIADDDSDDDGTPDCNDGCPDDPEKTSPGVCGCGESDVDTDLDGNADCIDICPGEDDFLDEDGNGVPDCAEQPIDTVPTVSTWGLLILAMLLLIAAKVAPMQREDFA